MEYVSRKPSKKLIVAVIVLVLIAVGCYRFWEYGRYMQWWGETDTLQRLKASPLADERLVGYKIMHSEQSQPVGIRGKYSSDYYYIWYDPAGKDPIEVRDEIVEFAEQNGFTYDPGTSMDPYKNLYKSTSTGGVMCASVQVVQSDDRLSSPDLIGSVFVLLKYR